jgi:hypothetical protein
MQNSLTCITPEKVHQMRTTLTLEDDAFSTAQTYAHSRSLKLGQAVSELIRRASSQQLPLKQQDGIWVFDLPADTPRATSAQVKSLLEDSV